ncbi:hypothetical protein ABGB17_24495 [Sphaerisporangium sp. B11E5]|uniref:hypothetical protein n=1 Tax=Sphaerisporangium sp. B11E5 TaxID=3153563 RepID=UPI00325F0458
MVTRYLDLGADDPEEYEGSHVVVDGAEYRIGPWVGEGGERIVHGLTNVRSGLSLHLLKIIKNQEQAEEVSRNTAANQSKLRDLGFPTVPEAMLVRGHGGVFELEEAASPEHGPYGRVMKEAWEAVGRDDWEQVEALCVPVLAANDAHVTAMHLLAMAAEARGDLMRAIRYESDAIAVEPNMRPFRVIWLRSAAAAGLVHGFTAGFAHFRSKWPVDNRQNALAAEVYLFMGRPDHAAGLSFREDEQEIARRVAAEDERRRQAHALTAEAYRARAADPHRAVELMRAAYRTYPKDVEVAYNWALELIRHGEPAQAHDVLAPLVQMIEPGNQNQCLGTLAFTRALQGDDEPAAGLLALVVDRLEEHGPLRTADLPLWAEWIQGDMVLAHRYRASIFVNDLLTRLGPRAPAQLHRLAAAYEPPPAGETH